VTIRTKEADAPNEFPPARLFLDDIEEIVRILVDATENRKEEWNKFNADAKTRVTLTIKDQVCDEVQELPKIAKKTMDLSVSIEVQMSLPQTFLRFSRFRTSLRSVGFTREQELSIYHNLAATFKRRNRRLVTLFRSHRVLFTTLFYLLLLAQIPAIVFKLNKQTTPTLATVISDVAFPIAITIGIAGLVTSFHHSIIILRHSSEPSPLRQELLQKIPVAAITSVLTFLLTMLGFYLKHKYWP
jgi:hypothetical protein